MKNQAILVTGGRGFVGARLVQMLNSTHPKPKLIISLDVKPLQNDENKSENISQIVGDFTNLQFVTDLMRQVDIVYHVGGLVGPFYPDYQYEKVNVQGTRNIILACKTNKVKVLVFCSSPSTRFQGPYGHDILGLQEKDLDYPKIYTHLYSKTKAEAEQLVLQANSKDLMTCAVAPHQVYGAGDMLFFPPVIRSAESGKLRIIGDGRNYCSYTYVDNICHALMLAGNKIENNPEIRGQFFIITDGVKTNMWNTIDKAIVRCGYESLHNKLKVPTIIVLCLAYIIQFLSSIVKKQISVLNPYAVRMMTINRYFNIEKSEKILGYKPLVQSDQAWEITCKSIIKERETKKQQDLKSGRVKPEFFDSFFTYFIYISMMAYVYFFQYDKFNLLSNPKNWGLYDFIFYFGLLMQFQIILDYILYFQYQYAEQKQELITSNNIHLDLDFTSKLYIFINRIQGIIVLYIYLVYCFNYPGIKMELRELDIINTVIAIPFYFIIYDFMYYWFHRYLHHPSIYRFIHKHHHRLIIPIRGNIDAINTHPLEYIGGSQMHLAAVHIFGYNHIYPMVIFLFFGGYLASINHTRINFDIFGIYQVKDHDIHHNQIVYNYGQYCILWDQLFKTRRNENPKLQKKIK